LPQSLVEALKRQREKAEAERRRKRAGINLKPPTAGDEFALKTLLASKRRTLGSRTDLGAQRKGRLA
jgi:hypothetical protein